ncbi:hypothetical protein C7M52_02715 [Mixta theicola]|nr:DUF3289 family protein [Mixta theicola]QHM76732.1 hypothetical protein C7M52_02715 [Mixta theicola]
MEALTFPCTIFTTQRKMDDTMAKDMYCGDLTASQLQKYYYLTDVSEKVDPYTCTKLTPFNLPQSRFYNMRGGGKETCSPLECARLMFDEMRSLSWPFSMYSPYRQLINKMIDHMQYSCGASFRDASLDMALREQILNDYSDKSTLKLIKQIIDRNINYEGGFYPLEAKGWFNNTLQDSILPKFSRVKDSFNGLGITVHDIYALKINILSLKVSGKHWNARIEYIAQDHFGLDDKDIMRKLYHQFRFFRLWFVLQRYEKYSYRPFFTNMSAVVDLKGGEI